MSQDNDGNEKLEDDKCFQEWKECNEKIAKFDNILIDLRKYGFTVASSLMTAGSFLGLQTHTQFQPFQIVIIFATMALVAVLYWLDIYYQTILAAIILRTQVLEKKLSFGIDIYVSRFYMRHRIGKALHLLYVGFLVSLLIIGGYVVHNNKLDYESGISLPLWILLLCVPIIFVFCLYFFFDRRRYRTYSEAQPIISNYLRNSGNPPSDKTIDQAILDFLDSDREDLGLDLETNEWLFFDRMGVCHGCRRRYLGLSHRLIVTDKRIYTFYPNLLWHTQKIFEYNIIKPDRQTAEKSITNKNKKNGEESTYYIDNKPNGEEESIFSIFQLIRVPSASSEMPEFTIKDCFSIKVSRKDGTAIDEKIKQFLEPSVKNKRTLKPP